MDEWSAKPRLPRVPEGTLQAILRAGAGPRDPLPCDLVTEGNLSGLPTIQPHPWLTGPTEMGPWWVPEGLG